MSTTTKAKIKVGSKIDLETHPLTRAHGVRGKGTVTAIRVTDPVNHHALVIVKSDGSLILHLQKVDTKGLAI